MHFVMVVSIYGLEGKKLSSSAGLAEIWGVILDEISGRDPLTFVKQKNGMMRVL